MEHNTVETTNRRRYGCCASCTSHPRTKLLLKTKQTLFYPNHVQCAALAMCEMHLSEKGFASVLFCEWRAKPNVYAVFPGSHWRRSKTERPHHQTQHTFVRHL